MVQPLRIAINGAAGRMGQAIKTLIAEAQGLELAGAMGRGSALPDCDVVIDFSSPDGLVALLPQVTAKDCALVTGTTGLNEAQQIQVDEAAKTIPVVQAGNMSLGVNLLAALVELTARRLGSDYDVEIHEAHHKHKKDAPSGTALMLGEAAARGRNIDFSQNAVRSREGLTGARTLGTIGFSVTRAGAIVGNHDVKFASDEEILTLSHHAQDRKLFARGALEAAKWVPGQKPGLYAMKDVLGLSL